MENMHSAFLLEKVASSNGAKLDEEFVKMMLEVEARFEEFSKHDRVRIELWTKKLCQVTSNILWKQNRNLYAMLLIKGLQRGSFIDPFNRMPPTELPTLNRQVVVSLHRMSRSYLRSQLKRLQTIDKEKLPPKRNSQYSTPVRARKGMVSARSRPSQESPSQTTSQMASNLRTSMSQLGLSSRQEHSLPRTHSVTMIARATPPKRPSSITSTEENPLPNNYYRRESSSQISTELELQEGYNSINVTGGFNNRAQQLQSELELARLNEESFKNEAKVSTFL